MTRVVVHIDRLVLRGMSRNDAETVSMALQAELPRLFGMPGATLALINQEDKCNARLDGITTEAIRNAICNAIVSGNKRDTR